MSKNKANPLYRGIMRNINLQKFNKKNSPTLIFLTVERSMND